MIDQLSAKNYSSTCHFDAVGHKRIQCCENVFAPILISPIPFRSSDEVQHETKATHTVFIYLLFNKQSCPTAITHVEKVIALLNLKSGCAATLISCVDARA